VVFVRTKSREKVKDTRGGLSREDKLDASLVLETEGLRDLDTGLRLARGPDRGNGGRVVSQRPHKGTVDDEADSGRPRVVRDGRKEAVLLSDGSH